MSRRIQGPDGVIHEFPDDATDMEIAAALGAPAESARGNVASNASKPQPNYNRQWARAGVNALPALGAVGGALVAAPFTAGLSIPAVVAGGLIGGGVGSIAGQGGRMALAPSVGLLPQMPNAGETAMDMAAAGLGNIVPPGAGAAGRALYDTGISPGTARLSRMPDLLQVMAERGILPSSKAADLIPPLRQQVALEEASTRSAAKAAVGAQKVARTNALQGQMETAADAARQAATGSSKGLIRNATASGQRFTARDAAGPALANAREFSPKPLTPQDEKDIVMRVKRSIDDALGERSGLTKRKRTLTYSASDFDAARQFYFNRAKAEAKGRGVVSPLTPFEDSVHGGLQDALHTIPGLKDARAAEQQAIQTVQAIKSGGMSAVNRMARKGSPIAQQAVSGRQLIGNQASAEAARAGAAARTAPLSPTARELMIRQAQLAAANRNPWLTRVGFPTALIPQMEARTGLALMNPTVQRLLQAGPLGADVLLRALLTPQETAPQETLPPNPAWGGSQP